MSQALSTSGCLLCGAELEYLPERLPLACAVCREMKPADARCRGGHFVCDRCHAADAVDWIERRCLDSTATEPLALAVELMRHPAVAMHGPEHHFLVPAVLLTAYSNIKGNPELKGRLLPEARRRAKQVVGGACGFHGACGAAVGVGIFISLVTGATPKSTGEWRLCNLATAEALVRIAERGGPRCCKRNTFLAIEAAAGFSAVHLGQPLPTEAAACEFFPANRECLGHRCGYLRPKTA